MSAASTTASISANFQRFLDQVRRLPGTKPASQVGKRDWITGIVFAATLVGVAGVALREYIAPDYRAEIIPMLAGLDAKGLQGAMDALPGYPAAALIELIPLKISLIFGATEGGAWRSASTFAVAVLAWAVWSAMPLVRGTNASLLAKRLAVAVAVGSPCTYWALRIGHPEEVFSTGFVLAALIAAAKEKPVVAGLLLGLAIGKAWPAVCAFPILALLLPDWRRLAIGVVCSGAMVVLFYAPAFLFAHNAVATLQNLGTHTIFNVGQVFWYFGTPIPEAEVMVQSVPQPRVAPVWVGKLSHPLILLLGLAIGAYWAWTLWRRMSAGRKPLEFLRALGPERLTAPAVPRRTTEQAAQLAAAALLICAGILYCRCFLDTWNVPYYLAPALIFGALGELLSGRTPMMTVVATGIMWKWCVPGDPTVRTDPDIYNALYIAWTVPFGLWFLWQGMKAVRAVQAIAGGDADAPSDADDSGAELAPAGAAQPA